MKLRRGRAERGKQCKVVVVTDRRYDDVYIQYLLMPYLPLVSKYIYLLLLYHIVWKIMRTENRRGSFLLHSPEYIYREDIIFYRILYIMSTGLDYVACRCVDLQHFLSSMILFCFDSESCDPDGDHDGDTAIIMISKKFGFLSFG